MQKEAQKAQKVFEATGFAIEDVTFKNKALVQAMNDSEVSAVKVPIVAPTPTPPAFNPADVP